MAQQTTLRGPVARAARDTAQSLLDDASAASASLRDSERHGRVVADDALHAFRVAVRRLRSWQEAFTPWLGKAASHKMKRRISGIAHATGASRDAAVQLSWPNQQRRTVSARQKPGVAWLIAWLNEPRWRVHAGYRKRYATTRRDETRSRSRSRSRSHNADADLSPGMLGIARRLRRRRLRAFGAIERDWLGGSTTPFFGDVRLLGAELKRHACTASWSGLARRPRGHAPTPCH
jgi:inorganic triphosphatase YgiF